VRVYIRCKSDNGGRGGIINMKVIPEMRRVIIMEAKVLLPQT
jgi:hypothetical protein